MNLHYYGFHVADYVEDARHLSLLEDLAYRRMLDLYYQQEEPLQNDTAAIARRIGMREHVAEVQVVLADFFVESPRGWRQKRCDDEIAEYRKTCRRNRSNGKLGGRPPKKSRTLPNGNPLGSSRERSGNPLSTQYSLSERVSEGACAREAEPAAEPAKLPSRLREPGPPPTVDESAEASALREWLFGHDVLRLSPQKRDVVLLRLLECCWQPKDLDDAAEIVGGKGAKQRASRLAALLLDAERFNEFNNDLCRRQAEAARNNQR